MQIFLLITALLFSGVVYANADDEQHKHAQHHDDVAKKPVNIINASIVSGADIKIGQQNKIVIKLNTRTGKVVTLDDLKLVHTQKIHLLVIDPTLTDYYHLHPVATNVAGEYKAVFTPKKSAYTIWVDITMADSGVQEYINASVGDMATADKVVNTSVSNNYHLKDYDFTLTTDQKLRVNSNAMLIINISKKGKPYTNLRPVMGAFAHLVGFSADYKSIVHLHPLGQEPSDDSMRGGSKLDFHFRPEQSGFVKLFAQFNIDGKDVFVPFGVFVN